MKRLTIFIIGLTLVGLFVFGISADETGALNFADMFDSLATVIAVIENTASKVIDFILELFT